MKSVLIYLAMIGVPVAALLAILQAGSRLAAPPAIGGEWRIVSVGPEPAGTAGCEADAVVLEGRTFVVSQSGVHLSATLRLDGERRLSGRLRGRAIDLASDAAGGASLVPPRSRCDAARGLSLDGTVYTDAPPKGMKGTLRFDSCRACAPLPFSAVHAEPWKRRGGR